MADIRSIATAIEWYETDHLDWKAEGEAFLGRDTARGERTAERRCRIDCVRLASDA